MGLGLGEERSPAVGSDLLGEVRVRNHRYLTGPPPPAPRPVEAVVGALRQWRTCRWRTCKWRASEGESIDAVEGDMTATARTLTIEAAVLVTVIVPSVRREWRRAGLTWCGCAQVLP
jgi:hypothetical protein